MRLPWPFGRSASDDGASSGSQGVGGAGTPSASSVDATSAAAEAPIRPTGAWRTLPPIQRSSGPPPVVAPAAPFLADVPGHAALPPIVTPLGHESSPSAPAGLVVAHPHAVPSLTSSAPLPSRPVQRHAAGGESASAAAPDWDAEEPPVVARQPDTASRAAASPSSSPSPALAPELPPIRSLSAVAPSAAVTPASRPLTQTAPTLAPLPSGRPGGATMAHDAARSRPADVAPPIQASGRVPKSVSSPSAGPTDAGRAPLAPVRRFAELPVETPAPPVQREAAGHRRAGLGAPLPAPPDSAVAQRLPMRPSQPAARPGVPASPGAPVAPTPRLSDGHHPAHDDGPITAPAPAAPPRPLPVLPVVRQRQDTAHAEFATSAASPSGARRSTPASPTSPATQPTVARQTASVLPTVGARPLRPAVTSTQAVPSAAAPSPGGAAGTGAGPDAPSAVPARWDTGDALPPTVTSLPAPTRAEPDLPVQLSPVGAATRPAAGPQGADGAREILFPPRDGTGGEGPAWSSGGFPAAPAAAPAAQAASGSSRSAPLTLARSVVAAPAQAQPAAPALANAPVVARIVADPASPGAPPVVQALPSGGGIPVATFTATPIVQREEAPASTAAQPSNGRSERELDELAKALFGRFRMQIKSEVIHEREAKGLGFDAF